MSRVILPTWARVADGGRQQQRQQHGRIAAAYDERKRRRRPGQKLLRTALNCETRV
jgi:predicted GNAT family N-acyltransferase